MKLKDAMPIYREYRQRLVNQTRDLVKQRDTAIAKLEATGDVTWSKEAATLELSIEATKKEFEENQKILDLGSGTAVLPVNLYRTGAHFTSTDISENQIAYGRKIADEKGLNNIDFKVCSAENTGFEDNCFDVVTAVQCFQYFNAEKASDEIFRILKPQGIFCKIFHLYLTISYFAANSAFSISVSCGRILFRSPTIP